jgi:molecular chaperone DnaK (HSP70)
MVADLGAGTFDLSVVEAYPKGRPHANGEGKYYYDVKWDDGSSRVAGLMFTDRLFQYVRSQIKFDLRRRQLDDLMRDAENAKRRLSEFESTTITVSGPDDDVDIDISRGKFEELTRDLMDQIIEKIRSALNRSNVPTPDVIVITGGASRMPMVERCIVESFPQYKGKVVCHKPGEAIAHGAARYAVKEQDDDIRQGAKGAGGAIIKRTTYDIGIRYHDISKEGDPIYVEVLVPKDTQVPYVSRMVQSEKRKKGRNSLFVVVEANCKDPDPYQPERDWSEVTRITADHGRVVEVGVPTHARISIDEMMMLHLLVTDPQNGNATLAETTSENLNLTDFA